MRRPRIALWIQLEGARLYPVLGGFRCKWWCPRWLWLWAVRRVDRWHEIERNVLAANALVKRIWEGEEQYVDPLTAVNEVFHKAFDNPKSTTLTSEDVVMDRMDKIADLANRMELQLPPQENNHGTQENEADET